MVIEVESGATAHTTFRSLPDYLNPGDVLVVNDTRVFPASFKTVKEETGDRIDVLIVRNLNDKAWEVMVHPPRKVRIGNTLEFSDYLTCDVIDNTISSGRVIQFHRSDPDILATFFQIGQVLLPPYLGREPEPVDRERMQSVFAEKPGSISTPSAGLHFSESLVDDLKSRGILIVNITLHLLQGHFEPIHVNEISKYNMQSEQFQITPESCKVINQAKQRGRRIISVGASVTRALESSHFNGETCLAQEGWTDLFIYPPYRPGITDGVISNFNLPQSKTMMLQSAFLSAEDIREVYHTALRENYRFGVFGDAALFI